MTALYKYFGSNNSLLRRIISYLRTIAKIRMESHKIKGITVKKQTTFLDDNDISMWYPLANRNYSGYTELIIAEGDSAAVSIDNARNSLYQAIFGVMGYITIAHIKIIRNIETLKCEPIGYENHNDYRKVNYTE